MKRSLIIIFLLENEILLFWMFIKLEFERVLEKLKKYEVKMLLLKKYILSFLEKPKRNYITIGSHARCVWARKEYNKFEHNLHEKTRSKNTYFTNDPSLKKPHPTTKDVMLILPPKKIKAYYIHILTSHTI